MRKFLLILLAAIAISSCSTSEIIPTQIPANGPTSPTSQSALEPTLETILTPTHLPTATSMLVMPPKEQLSFIKGSQRFGSATSFSVVVADIDMDGDNDIFIANMTANSKLWINDGAGNFTDSGETFGPPNSIYAHDAQVADLNGDGTPDIFLLFHRTTSKIFLNDGAGFFGDHAQEIFTVGDTPQFLANGDVENDGDVDIFITYARSPNRLWLNDGEGSFTLAEEEYGAGPARRMGVGDFNGNGAVDLFYCFVDRPGEMWFNDGTGAFTNSNQAIGNQYGCENFDLGDIDGDGDIDLAVGNIESGISIWLNEDNTGEFISAGSLFAEGVINLNLVDVDNDSDLDLVASDIQDGNILWRNRGEGQFTEEGTIFGEYFAHDLAAEDLDGDGDQDVVIGFDSDNNGTTIYWNE